MAPADLRSTLDLIRATIAPPGDAELLARHLAAPGGPAFAELVRRHGPMVFTVCRRMLGNDPDARDAFQETFLRFLRQVRSVRRAELLAGWLYRVAANECRRLRARTVIRAAYEESAAQSRPQWAGDADEPERRELLRILDEEVERLPEPLRTALVLCDLQGLAQVEAARRVGWPRSTLAFRLERARAILRNRLRRRGYESSADLAVMPALALPTPLLEWALARTVGAAAVVGWRPGRMFVALTAAAVLAGVGLAVGSSSPPSLEKAAAVVALAPPPATEPKPDVTQLAIERGERFLRRQEAGKGNWENDATPIAMMAKGGWSCLALLSLMYSGVPPDDPVIQRGLAWLRPQQFGSTYVVGLQTAVYARAGLAEDKPRIQKNVDWLLRARSQQGQQLRGWSYDEHSGTRTDNSNTQFAVFGLDVARQAGAKIDRAVWRDIHAMYLRTQQPDSGWNYESARAVSTRTMTEAGVNGLLLSGLALSGWRSDQRPDDSAALRRGLELVGKEFTVRPRMHAFYSLFGIARLGRNSGLRFFGNRDWYREGRELLLKIQHPDGSWSVTGQLTDNWPVVSTSFALLFLTEGRTPILVRKFAHGPDDDNWNRTRYDARHLAEYASRTMFRGRPVTWQVCDLGDQKALSDDELAAEARDLGRSPVVYLTSPQPLQLTDVQKRLLRRYVEGGGLLLAEGGGSPAFDKWFRQLVKELFPKDALRPLPANHPLYRKPKSVPADQFPLEAVERGGRLAVVFSPKPLAAWWGWGPTTDGPGAAAFRLAGNLFALATGGKLPPPGRE